VAADAVRTGRDPTLLPRSPFGHSEAFPRERMVSVRSVVAFAGHIFADFFYVPMFSLDRQASDQHL